MLDPGDERRTHIGEFLASLGPTPKDQLAHEDKPMVGSAVLTGWVLVTEWMDQDGERYLQSGWSDSKAAWEAVGMAHVAICMDID